MRVYPPSFSIYYNLNPYARKNIFNNYAVIQCTVTRESKQMEAPNMVVGDLRSMEENYKVKTRN